VDLKMTTVGTVPGLNTVISHYTKTHPGVSISVTAIPSNNYQSTLLTELRGGNGPDIMFVWGGYGNPMAVGELASAGYLAKLNSQPWVPTLSRTGKSVVDINGAVLALPLNYEVVAFFYNKEAFQKAHITPPASFAQLASDCSALNKVGITPIDEGNEVGYINTLIPAIFADDYVYWKDPTFYQDLAAGKVSLASSALWRQAIEVGNEDYAQLFKDHCFEPNSTATTDTESVAAVASGHAAMNAMLTEFEDYHADNPKGSFGSFEPGLTSSPKSAVLTMDPSLLLAVNAHSHHVSQAEAFLSYLAQPVQAAYLSRLSDDIPSVRVNGFHMPQLFQGLSSFINKDQEGYYFSTYSKSPQTKTVWIAEAEDIATGTATPQQASAAVIKTLNG
jgi:raffinose/stachyose/melibiose transport system substrate-binding protein